jgi:hypothetical protein
MAIWIIYTVVTLLMIVFVVIDRRIYEKTKKYSAVIEKVVPINPNMIKIEIILKDIHDQRLIFYDKSSSFHRYNNSEGIVVYVVDDPHQTRVFTKRKLNLWLLRRFLIVDVTVLVMAILVYIGSI